MGRNSKRYRSRKLSGVTQRERSYATSWRNKTINNQLNEDEFRQKQSQLHKELAAKEQEVLSRSIFVTNVLDLRVEANLEALERFFTLTYGRVKFCKRTEYRTSNRQRSSPKHSFPPARVQFFNKHDAERVFGNTGLSSTKQKSIEISCPVGYKNGKIMVRPCMRSNDLLLEETQGMRIPLNTSGLIFGNWCPGDQDMYVVDDESVDPDVWLSVADAVAPVVVIDLKDRCIEIKHDGEVEEHRIMFKFKELWSPISLCREQTSQQFSIIFSLKQPPRVHRKEHPFSFLFLAGLFREPEFERSDCWETVPAKVLGSCLGYKLLISEQQILQLINHEQFGQLRECGVLGFDSSSLQNPRLISSQLVGHNYDDMFDTAVAKLGNFQIASLLAALHDCGKFTAYHAMTENKAGSMVNLVDRLRLSHNPTSIKHAILTLEKMLSGFGFTKYPCRLFSELVQDATSHISPPLPVHSMLIPRIRLSPLRVLNMGMGIETSNRAVRYFTNKADFAVDMFLRVSITEEDGAPIAGSELALVVRERFRKALVDGITICGRKYVFLAYSSSQLTECSAWMVCHPRGWTVAKMRKELGNFSKCTTPSKLGARLGQCFSTTFTSSLPRHIKISHAVVGDIEGSNGCHSDGTGMISRKALDKLLLGLPIGPKNPKDVSIIQIRFGGAKGTLTAFDNPTAYLPARTPVVDVYLRPSMIKFDGEFSNVEVCSVGKNVPYYLNRNVILLMVALGIHENHFLDMQKQMLDDLDAMLSDRNVALRMVPSLTGAENHSRKVILAMLSAGLCPSTEPFLYACLSAMRNHQLFALRKKSRILVCKGAVLVGGLDETGLVPEDCVFFQVDESPHEGYVLVTKHPVMHPGDLRMLRAIDVPELRSHRNMILFSKHGSRPEADKMSGSDLDGDEFAVTWDKRLVLPLTLTPMNFEGPDTRNVTQLSGDPEKVTNELVLHFLNHIRNASVGQISMLWLDYAAAKGANCEECLELASLHSVAVDYPKSGVPAEIPHNLRMKASEPRPHWREKKSSPSYECQSVIGKLYDQVIGKLNDQVQAAKRHQNNVALAGRKVDRYGTISCETAVNYSTEMLQRVHNSKIPFALMAMTTATESESSSESTRLPTDSIISPELQQLVNEERFSYEEQFLHLINKYRIRGEGETYTGCIRKFHKFYRKRQHDFTQEIRRQCDDIRKRYRRAFFELVAYVLDLLPDPGAMEEALSQMTFSDTGEEDEAVDGDDARLNELEEIALKAPDMCSKEERVVQRVAFAIAAAYYNSSYHPEHRWASRDRMVTLYSFPWLVADVICGAYGSFYGIPTADVA